jgi:MoxR-like ATPase
MQDEGKLARIQEEMAVLKEVLVQRLETGINALEGGFLSVKEHLWIASEDADAVAAALMPKLEKSQTSIQTTLFELVTLELAVERRVSAVVLANLMPRYWADFIRSSSDQEARSMGTVPY